MINGEWSENAEENQPEHNGEAPLFSDMYKPRGAGPTGHDVIYSNTHQCLAFCYWSLSRAKREYPSFTSLVNSEQAKLDMRMRRDKILNMDTRKEKTFNGGILPVKRTMKMTEYLDWNGATILLCSLAIQLSGSRKSWSWTSSCHFEESLLRQWVNSSHLSLPGVQPLLLPSQNDHPSEPEWSMSNFPSGSFTRNIPSQNTKNLIFHNKTQMKDDNASGYSHYITCTFLHKRYLEEHTLYTNLLPLLPLPPPPPPPPPLSRPSGFQQLNLSPLSSKSTFS